MVLTDKLRRPSALAVAALLLLASFTPLLSKQKVGAYGLLTSREIRISNSNGAATDVTYLVQATTPTTNTVGSIAVQFCSNSPIIGDSCTAPTGFDVNEAGLAIASQTGITDWTATPHASTTTNILVLTRAAASSFTAGQFNFEMGAGGGTDGVTNPTNDNETFYARILTFTDIDDDGDGCSGADDSATCYPTTAIENNSLHAGGIALSTAEQITVTAKVQERLTFCVYTDGNGDTTLGDANTSNCTGVAGSAVTLGDTNGVLTDAGAYVNTHAMFNVSTNASLGATIRAKGSTLTSGGNTINAIGSGTAEAGSTPGTEQFGFCTYESDGTGLVIELDYDGHDDIGPGTDYCDAATHTSGGAPGGTGTDVNFAFITGSLSSTYGDAIATKPAGQQSTGRLAFLGNIATVTEPGIYTSILTFIATGNY